VALRLSDVNGQGCRRLGQRQLLHAAGKAHTGRPGRTAWPWLPARALNATSRATPRSRKRRWCERSSAASCYELATR